jgi:hypothetical protein
MIQLTPSGPPKLILLPNVGYNPPDFVRGANGIHYRKSREHLLYRNRSWNETPFQARVLAWFRDNIHKDIPRKYRELLLGHDIHLSQHAELYVRHFHANERDPFTGKLGWTEDLGRVSSGKVTTAFRDFEALMLVTDSTLVGDFKYHESGTSATAEANTDTALVATAITGSLAARVAGTQTNPTASTYQSIATLTATGTATWQEHGIFNASSGVTLLDRSLISPTVPVVSGDTVQFTYVLTKNAEP